MLINRFYQVTDKVNEAGSIRARITFIRDHQIFRGHFPQVPIVPGVCMMQIVRETLGAEIGANIQLLDADNIKFLSVINPDETKEVELTLKFQEEEDRFVTSATLSAHQTTFFKFSGIFQQVR